MATVIVGRITGQTGQLALGLLDDLELALGVITRTVRKNLRQYSPRSINSDVQFPPTALSSFPMLCCSPFAFSNDGQVGAVDDQVDTFLGLFDTEAYFQSPYSAARGLCGRELRVKGPSTPKVSAGSPPPDAKANEIRVAASGPFQWPSPSTLAGLHVDGPVLSIYCAVTIRPRSRCFPAR
ncbi:MAG: hypothetical protein ACI8X5_003164 [Planctomycetota bacterium]|jgi:hypothetical protein